MSDETNNNVQGRASDGHTRNSNATVRNRNQAYGTRRDNQNEVHQVAENIAMRQSSNGWDRLPRRPVHPAWHQSFWRGNHVNQEGEEKKDEEDYYSHFAAVMRE